MRSLSIRWRLTIAYGVILTTLLAGLALFLYRQQESYLIDNAASRLRSQAYVAINSLPADDPVADPRVASSALSAALGGPDTTATLMREDGRPFASASAPSATPLSLDLDTYVRASAGETLQRISDLGDDRSISVLVPIRREDGDVDAIVQIDSSLAPVEASLERLQLLLTVGVVVAHVLGLVLILAATSWSLSPLTRIVEVCRAIARGDYGRRATLPRGADELGELGRALDSMIGEVQATVQQREWSEQLTRQFAADASHELKSPLTVISGYVDVLLRTGASDPQQLQRALTGIQREAERMSRLIADLLALAQLEAGSRPMQTELLNMSELIREVAEESRLRSDAREFLLRLDEDGWVKIDGEALRQALRNLIDNAVRHTDPGGTIALEMTSDASASVVRIVDGGQGIDPRHLPHVFERFYRAEPSRSRTGNEAGLGLAITRALIEANGGSIAVGNRAGAGACFTIRLPLAPPEALDVDEIRASQSSLRLG